MYPLGPAVPAFFSLLSALFIQLILLQLTNEKNMGAPTSSKVKVFSVHHSPLILKACHFILRGSKAGQALLASIPSTLLDYLPSLCTFSLLFACCRERAAVVPEDLRCPRRVQHPTHPNTAGELLPALHTLANSVISLFCTFYI